MRKRCYSAFARGETRVTRPVADVVVSYEAISAKNYWHLTAGNQEEDQFIDSLLPLPISLSRIFLDRKSIA